MRNPEASHSLRVLEQLILAFFPKVREKVFQQTGEGHEFTLALLGLHHNKNK